jgi:hypothetical protein
MCYLTKLPQFNYLSSPSSFIYITDKCLNLLYKNFSQRISIDVVNYIGQRRISIKFIHRISVREEIKWACLQASSSGLVFIISIKFIHRISAREQMIIFGILLQAVNVYSSSSLMLVFWMLTGIIFSSVMNLTVSFLMKIVLMFWLVLELLYLRISVFNQSVAFVWAGYLVSAMV